MPPLMITAYQLPFVPAFGSAWRPVAAGGPVADPISFETAVVAAGPEWFWKMDENTGTVAVDTMGNGNLEYEADSSTYSVVSSAADGLGYAKDFSGGITLQMYDPVYIVPIVPTSFETSVIDAAPEWYWKLDENTATQVVVDTMGNNNLEYKQDANTADYTHPSSTNDGLGYSKKVSYGDFAWNYRIRAVTGEYHVGKFATEDWTVEMGMAFNTITTNDNVAGCWNGGAGSNSAWRFGVSGSNSDKFVFSCFEEDHTNHSGHVACTSIAAAGISNDSAWHWLSIRADSATGLITFFIDGTDAHTTPIDISSWSGAWNIDDNSRFNIGAAHTQWAMDGYVDNCAIYNKALTDEERERNYNWWKYDSATIESPVDYINYWKMDDASGYIQDETNLFDAYSQNGNPTYSVVAQVGTGITFDGIEDWYGLDNLTTGFVEPIFTHSVWLKTTSTSAQTYFSNFDNNSSKYSGWNITLTSGGLPQFYLNSNTGTVYLTDYSVAQAGTAVNDGNWHHVVCVYNGTSATIFVDGVLDSGSVTWPIVHDAAKGSVMVGARHAVVTHDQHFGGTLDDMKYFDRAIDANEIAAMYIADGGT